MPLGLAVDLLGDQRHQLGALVADELDEGGIAEHAPDSRVEDDRELRVGDRDRADRLIEQQRIDDLVAAEGVDDEPLLVGSDDLERRRVEVEDALVELDHVVDERPFVIEAGRRDHPDRIAEAKHQRLLRRVDDEHAEIEGDRDRDEDHEADAEDTALH